MSNLEKNSEENVLRELLEHEISSVSGGYSGTIKERLIEIRHHHKDRTGKNITWKHARNMIRRRDKKA